MTTNELPDDELRRKVGRVRNYEYWLVVEKPRQQGRDPVWESLLAEALGERIRCYRREEEMRHDDQPEAARAEPEEPSPAPDPSPPDSRRPAAKSRKSRYPSLSPGQGLRSGAVRAARNEWRDARRLALGGDRDEAAAVEGPVPEPPEEPDRPSVTEG